MTEKMIPHHFQLEESICLHALPFYLVKIKNHKDCNWKKYVKSLSQNVNRLVKRFISTYISVNFHLCKRKGLLLI